MQLRNFPNDQPTEIRLRNMLGRDELPRVIVRTASGFVAVTSKRVLFYPTDGNLSAIRTASVSLVDARKAGAGWDVKVHYGGNYNRIVSDLTQEEAEAVLDAITI